MNTELKLRFWNTCTPPQFGLFSKKSGSISDRPSLHASTGAVQAQKDLCRTYQVTDQLGPHQELITINHYTISRFYPKTMFEYLSFLRPPPEACPLGQPVTFVPQIALTFRWAEYAKRNMIYTLLGNSTRAHSTAAGSPN
ncbi:hypothetical protein AG1IA_03284 [Rhizoctonia solani AG-1 IA]|uniref:Uncharacterized protein n=1 Tax=Thanatephorus cucumeris (strain AG1-IA) TaxID=983506 RepID=L8X0R6_THACA|nr:hypothetical protein AG1IA_03284 [Rhizoctonia solani AG-1 IA]